jgi:hypothetical protein
VIVAERSGSSRSGKTGAGDYGHAAATLGLGRGRLERGRAALLQITRRQSQRASRRAATLILDRVGDADPPASSVFISGKPWPVS